MFVWLAKVFDAFRNARQQQPFFAHVEMFAIFSSDALVNPNEYTKHISKYSY